MTEQNRKYKRLDKIINMRFCIADVLPKKWDITVVQNISAGGVRFVAPSGMIFKDQMLQLQIRIPELAPLILEIDATVVDVKPHSNAKYCDIRAKFTNLSQANQIHLIALEEMIDRQFKKRMSEEKDKEKKD